MLGTMTSGGRLMDEGMYGCIFTPSLICKKKAEQPRHSTDSKPLLSKIINTEDAELEMNIANIIRKLPLWKNYFAVAESICEPAVKQSDKDIPQCAILTNKSLSNFRLLSMTHRGTPWSTYRFDNSTFEFMPFVNHLIEAGALLTLFGIIHRDLHQGNIIIDDENVPRIIDFNLAILKESKFTSSDLIHTYNINTPQEPPDSTLVNAIALGYVGENVIQSLVYKKSIIKKISSVLGISLNKMTESLEQFMGISAPIQKGNSVEWMTHYWTTVDSWAIGVLIVHFISNYSLWPSFAPVLKKHSPTLFPLLRRMCAVSPIERVDCVQALYYLNPNHFIIRNYGKAWIEKKGSGRIS
jgi:serine/threonine protein kinase